MLEYLRGYSSMVFAMLEYPGGYDRLSHHENQAMPEYPRGILGH